MVNSPSSSCLPPLSPCPLSLAVAGAPSVCRFVRLVAMRRVVLFLFLPVLPRVLCICFVVGVRGGFFVLCSLCLLNVCVLHRKVPSQHASIARPLLFVPSSCLVACRRSAVGVVFFVV